MRRNPTLPLLMVGFVLAGCQSAPPPPPVIDNPEGLIEAMRVRYDGKWYPSLTFLQNTVRHKPDGATDTSLWYEARYLPGNLRIDFGDTKAGNGGLCRDDSVFTLSAGKMNQKTARVHPLLLLGFDVYFLPPAETAQKLRDAGFDLSVMREAFWQDRPTYVGGAEKGDSTSAQFWIDKENLYFVRMIEPVGGGVSEVLFDNYERLGDAWISPVVKMNFNGKLNVEELYYDIKIGQSFDPTLFDENRWLSSEHWYR